MLLLRHLSVRVHVLTARLSGSVHGDFDGAVVGGHLRRSGEHGDGQGEALPCSTATERKATGLSFIITSLLPPNRPPPLPHPPTPIYINALSVLSTSHPLPPSIRTPQQYFACSASNHLHWLLSRRSL